MKHLYPRLFFSLLLFFFLIASCAPDTATDHKNRLALAGAALKSNHFIKTLAFLRQVNDPQLKTQSFYLMQGLSYFKIGDYKASVGAFKKAEPESLALNIYIAYLYLLMGDADHAHQLADQLSEQFGDRPEISVLKGNISLKQHVFAEAEKEFIHAIQQQKNFVKGYIGLANLFLTQRRFNKAEENFVQAVFLSQDEPIAYVALANFYFLMHRYQDAENNLKNALSRFPGDINCLMLLGAVHIKTEHYLEAMHIFKQAQALQPESLRIRVNIIKVLLQLEQFEKAFPLIQALLEDEEEQFAGFGLSGEYYLRKNDLGNALSRFKKALVFRPNSYEINYYLGLIHLLRNELRLSKQFLEQSISNFPGFTKSHVLLALIQMSSHKYQLASEHAKLVLLLDPGNVSAHTLNAFALYLQGDEQEARYEFEVAEKFSREKALMPLFQAMTALEKKSFPAARKAIADIDSQFSEKVFLGLELLKQGHSKEKDLARVLSFYLEKDPGFFAFLSIGNFYRERGNFIAASEYLQKSFSLNEQNVIFYYLLAEIKTAEGNIDEAISLLKQSIQIDPLFLKSYQALGILYEKAKDFEEAKLTYQKGLGFYPEDSILLNNLGWIFLTHFKDQTLSYPYIRKAADISLGDTQVQDTLAWWYYSNKEYKRAIRLLKKIIKEAPGQAVFHFHLGMSYQAIKKVDLSEKHLKEALKLNISPVYAEQINNVLKR